MSEITSTQTVTASHAPMPLLSLYRKWADWPAGDRYPLLAGAIRGRLRLRIFDDGRSPIIGPGVRLQKRNGRIVIGDFARLKEGCRIAVVSHQGKPATLSIGAFTTIAERTIINCADEIVIGHHCSVSWDCNIMDTSFHRVFYDDGTPERPVAAPIFIGDRVLIGARTIIMRGVTIGSDSVIGAGSVVTRDIPAHAFAAGNPARVVRSIAGWSRK